MQDSHRRYNCARCRKLVIICRTCDRGHRYCLDDCSQIRRRESQKRAEQKYQKGRQGKRKHAARQQRYRERCTIKKAELEKKVTDQGSPSPAEKVKDPAPRIINSTRGKEKKNVSMSQKKDQHRSTIAKTCCHYCGQPSCGWLRREFLGWRTAYRQFRPSKKQKNTAKRMQHE